ncbi:unnamed protein product [Protopolystoma xenopodis]|uniref:Uncharacterized protein n=1 Tax=Protopolystoma xenopodis TaxID=117903 RepID=A0A448XP42_9PLAT|nr:unnamed protein product [Protopolystoma xenopodis]
MTQSALLNSHPLHTKALNSLSSEPSLNTGDALKLRNHLTVGAPVERVPQASNAVITKTTKSQIIQDFTNFTTAKTTTEEPNAIRRKVSVFTIT